VLSPRFTPPEAYSVPLTFRLFRFAVPVEERLANVALPDTPSAPRDAMLPFVSMYVLPELTSSDPIAVAPNVELPETLSEPADTAPEEVSEETLVTPAVNFDRPESPATSSVPPTVVLPTVVAPETLSEPADTAPEEVSEETFVIPAVRPVSVELPVTPNVPPTVALPETAAETSFVAPALRAEKVALPVMPSVPIEETLPVESITNLPAPTLRDETPAAPSVVAPAVRPASVDAPVTPREAREVAPAVSPASVDAPLTDSVPAEEAPVVLSELAVKAPEERVPRIDVLPVVPLIVNLSVFTANEPPCWTERLSAATLVAETAPSVVVPAVRLVSKVALGDERDVVKLPVGAETELKVAAPAVRPASVDAPVTPREARDVAPAVRPASVDAPETPSVPPSEAAVESMEDEPTVRPEALTAPAVSPASVVAPRRRAFPPRSCFPSGGRPWNLSVPTRRSPVMFVAPVVVSDETSSSSKVVVPFAVTFPENTASPTLVKFPRTLTSSLMVVETWSAVVLDAENRLRKAARSPLIY
jgi:hypothetical protein